MREARCLGTSVEAIAIGDAIDVRGPSAHGLVVYGIGKDKKKVKNFIV